MALGTALATGVRLCHCPWDSCWLATGKSFILCSAHFCRAPGSLQEQGSWCQPGPVGTHSLCMGLHLPASLPASVGTHSLGLHLLHPCLTVALSRGLPALQPAWFPPCSVPWQWCCPDPSVQCQGAQGCLGILLLWAFGRGRRNGLGWQQKTSSPFTWLSPEVLQPCALITAASQGRGRATGQSWLCQTWKWQKCWWNFAKSLCVSGLTWCSDLFSEHWAFICFLFPTILMTFPVDLSDFSFPYMFQLSVNTTPHSLLVCKLQKTYPRSESLQFACQ